MQPLSPRMQAALEAVIAREQQLQDGAELACPLEAVFRQTAAQNSCSGQTGNTLGRG